MIEYPTILHWNEIVRGKPCYAFNKLDGNNMRFGWTKKKGFHKFGTRRDRINERNSDYGKAIPLFMNKYSEPLERIFKKNKRFRNIRDITVFYEYYGENSFGGQHDINDIMNITLFDVHLGKQGFMPPNEFIKTFGELGIPKLIYTGNLNQEFINDIKTNLYNLKEGVVCKGIENKKIWMGKLKTDDWISRVKNKL